MKYPLSEIGSYTLMKQKELADIYNYKKLPYDISLNCMRYYVTSLPQGFHLKDDALNVKYNPEINECIIGYEIIKDYNLPIVSRDGTIIAYKYKRIVIGHYGAFIEIEDKDICKEHVIVEPGQEYRIQDRRYRDKVKYQWYTAKDNSHCKLYKQTRQVAYADYQEDMWYISPFEVLDQQELKDFLLNGGSEQYEDEEQDIRRYVEET